MSIKDFENWKDFFEKKLTKSNLYIKKELGKHGDTIMERFSPKCNSDKTDILIGYLDETLIFWKFENALAVGFNQQQDIEYFYRYDFSPEKSYGKPGLEFKEYNVSAIESQLDEGLKGVEIQYFKNDKLIKSKIILDEPYEYSTTINFEKQSFWKSLFNSENEILEEKRIELSKIFSGLKNKNGR